MDHDTKSFFELDRLLRMSPKPDRSRREVLVVDDEPSICAMVTEILRPLGYTIWSARSGEEALTKLAERAPAVGLVLIDVFMPNMDGLSLLAAVRKRYLSMPVVLVSGRLTADTRWLASERDCRYLAKPFNVMELVQLTEEILGPSSDSVTV